MRSRNIKPGFFKNEALAELPVEGRLLFSGLWCLADREGRLEDRPKRIAIDVFPYDRTLGVEDVQRLLDALEQHGFIRRYQVGDLRLMEVVNFKKHQSPHKTEKASTLPAPLVNGALTVNPPLQNGENPPDSLIPDSLIHGFTDSPIDGVSDSLSGAGGTQGGCHTPVTVTPVTADTSEAIQEYAKKILEKLVMVDHKLNLEAVQGAIELEFKQCKDLGDAYRFILNSAREDRDAGMVIDKFYFIDWGKQRHRLMFEV
jgi:hypothetical protein